MKKVDFEGRPATHYGMARDEHDWVAVIQIDGADRLILVHPSRIGINYYCGYCGSTELMTELYEGAWPSCPDCGGI